MEQPKEPGFYWAMIPWTDAPGEWVPVHLMEYGGRLIALAPGDEQEIEPAELVWGPRIYPPGTVFDEVATFDPRAVGEMAQRLKALRAPR